MVSKLKECTIRWQVLWKTKWTNGHEQLEIRNKVDNKKAKMIQWWRIVCLGIGTSTAGFAHAEKWNRPLPNTLLIQNVQPKCKT